MIFLVHISSCTWHILKLKRAYDLFWEIVEAWHHVSECMSSHKELVLITRRAHCFHDWIYITPILLLWDLSNVCVVDQIWSQSLILYIFIYIFIKNILYICIYNIYNIYTYKCLWIIHKYIYIYIYIIYIYVYIYIYICKHTYI